LNYKNRFYYSF